MALVYFFPMLRNFYLYQRPNRALACDTPFSFQLDSNPLRNVHNNSISALSLCPDFQLSLMSFLHVLSAPLSLHSSLCCFVSSFCSYRFMAVYGYYDCLCATGLLVLCFYLPVCSSALLVLPNY